MDSSKSSQASATSCAPSIRRQSPYPAQRKASPAMNHGNTDRTPKQPAPLASLEMLHRRGPYGPRVIPDQTMRCARCDITFHRAALYHDRALLLASCCPRCDGLLVPDNRRAATRTDTAHTTTSTVLRRSTAWAPHRDGLVAQRAPGCRRRPRSGRPRDCRDTPPGRCGRSTTRLQRGPPLARHRRRHVRRAAGRLCRQARSLARRDSVLPPQLAETTDSHVGLSQKCPRLAGFSCNRGARI